MPSGKMSFEELAASLSQLAEVPSAALAIVVTDPDAAEYARALEYGSIAGRPPWPNPGPRTTRAVDPETGEEIVVSLQAPHGFIRIHLPEIAEAIAGQLKEGPEWLNPAAVASHVQDAVRVAAQQALERIRSSAPRDSGALRNSLQVTDG